MAVRALSTLLGSTPGTPWDDTMLAAAPPRVAFACIKFLWHEATAAHDDAAAASAADRLRRFAGSFQHTDAPLAARAYLRLGEWARARDDVVNEHNLAQIVGDARTATELDSGWWKAWHAWALVNYDAVQHYSSITPNPEAVRQHLLPAIRGFINLDLAKWHQPPVHAAGLAAAADAVVHTRQRQGGGEGAVTRV